MATPINSQFNVSQTSQDTVPSKYTTVTSNDPSVLQQQKKQIENEMTQLRKSGGSSSQIQKLNSALASVDQRLQSTASAGKQTEQAEATDSTPSSKFFNQIDTKA
jgi:hypothetical protein